MEPRVVSTTSHPHRRLLQATTRCRCCLVLMRFCPPWNLWFHVHIDADTGLCVVAVCQRSTVSVYRDLPCNPLRCPSCPSKSKRFLCPQIMYSICGGYIPYFIHRTSQPAERDTFPDHTISLSYVLCSTRGCPPPHPHGHYGSPAY
jgi:hypothetical protein